MTVCRWLSCNRRFTCLRSEPSVVHRGTGELAPGSNHVATAESMSPPCGNGGVRCDCRSETDVPLDAFARSASRLRRLGCTQICPATASCFTGAACSESEDTTACSAFWPRTLTVRRRRWHMISLCLQRRARRQRHELHQRRQACASSPCMDGAACTAPSTSRTRAFAQSETRKDDVSNRRLARLCASEPSAVNRGTSELAATRLTLPRACRGAMWNWRCPL